MKFTPKKEEELKIFDLMPEGTYNFEVIYSERLLSKSGNEMIKIKLGIYDNSGKIYILFDYLLEAMAFKLRHFCYCVGLGEQYELGEINENDCIGRNGKVQISIEKGKDKSEGGKYPDRNFVKDYLISNEEVKKDEFINDDLPF